MSLEDDLLDSGLGAERAEKIRKFKREPPKQLARFAALFRKSQEKIERKHFHSRKMLLHQEKNRQDMQREMGQDPYLDTAGA